jgi:hypothetical protein
MIGSEKNKPMTEKQSAGPVQLKVRSDLRAGVQGDCQLGIGYWRKEYNYWKNLAKQLGCI